MNGFVAEYLEHIIPVSFVLRIGDEEQRIGKENPRFTVDLKKNLNKKEMLTSTSLSLGEAYMRGDLEVDHDLYEVLNCFMGEMDKFKIDKLALKGLLNTSRSKKNQEKEVRSHYDIGNDFYRLWLDETMSYSCGYFKEETDSLYQAQVNKVDHILDKLSLEPGMSLLDIGCGWGFLLKRAAKEYGVHGTGITLSEEQYQKFRQEIEDEGLDDLLEVRRMDYRELKKSGMKFDRIVSVGMIEHVGRGNYEEFMENIDAVLKCKGLCLLHFISALEEHEGDAWIKKYIFPGGVIPSLREIIHILPEHHFYTLDVESLRRHYNKTLLFWRENFNKCRTEIVEGKGEEFARMWELYLTSCAAAFQNGVVDIHQLLLSKGVNNELPLNRVV
ncbi:MAG: cyclopropane-fatty-acyl-phospholipid synthase family protein [Lachnospiraceae bacterium]|nr:cyclopropane-fatty-acyl-phospholipid synthase family protein [Lachnospiraceae bacterium]